MRQTIREGLSLAQQLAALPFRAARQAFRQTDMSQRPLGDVVQETLHLGEGLAQLPFKATSALLSEVAERGPSLADRVSALERRLGVDPPEPIPVPADDPANPEA